jgi:nucleoside triphosphatase
LKEIGEASELLTAAGVEVLAPTSSEIVSEQDGFVLMEGEDGLDPRLVELRYLKHLRRLGPQGSSLFVVPGGRIGLTASYELGLAQALGVRTIFTEAPDDHPVYLPGGSIYSVADLAKYIEVHQELPAAYPVRDIKGTPEEADEAYHLWEHLSPVHSIVAVGALIEYRPKDGPVEVLLVKTHKWGGRYSIIGGKVNRHELLQQALLREIMEETGLTVEVKRHLDTSDQIKDSGFYIPVQQIFVDFVAEATTRDVKLNGEAQGHLWIPAAEALATLEIEPNAKHLLEIYVQERQ